MLVPVLAALAACALSGVLWWLWRARSASSLPAEAASAVVPNQPPPSRPRPAPAAAKPKARPAFSEHPQCVSVVKSEAVSVAFDPNERYMAVAGHGSVFLYRFDALLGRDHQCAPLWSFISLYAQAL